MGFSIDEAKNEINVISSARSFAGELLWNEVDASSTFLPEHFTIEGHHKLGPLPYAKFPEVARLFYIFRLGKGAPTPNVKFLNEVTDSSNVNMTPTSFIPAVYFKDDVLTEAYGLSFDGSKWEKLNPNVGNANYFPTLYRFRAVAWMTPDLGWGVSIYSRETLTQEYNFALEKKPTEKTNMINVINQNLGVINRGEQVTAMAHMVVGDLETMKNIINIIYDSGN
ncbi:hypothetical protein [Zooshikella ganghwensis]|uniref:Uncharacterized protein n=1 Tax=Zooshikella ganghwensis TaxID=202772 RepID=A0A4V1INW7_9GAMM|nr:hypothetical protein [Zooshikella ganghwensis]RDH45171.1 hypothetical protein B9G39_17950 [Zooshikella ganghwensis]